MLEELNKRRQAVADNISKAFVEDIEKARYGVYDDNPENRRLNRVGQQYGSKKKKEEPSGKSKSNSESGSYEHYAKQASDSALMRAAADDNAKPGVQEAAKKEIKRRKETNVEQKNALETLLDEDPTAYEKIAYSGLSNEDWLKKVSQGEDKTLADAAKERLQDLKKVNDVMTAFDDITMDDDEFDVLVDSIVGKSGASLKLRKTILSKDFNDDNDKRKAYESAIEQLVWMMKP